MEHEATDPDDQAGLLGERDELAGGDRAAVGVLPADQRLDPDDVSVGERDDRLVVAPELARVERALEVRLEVETLDDGDVHPGSNTSKRSRPSRLARYIAMSALRSTSAGVSPSSSYAMPMLAVTCTSVPSTSIGSRTSSRMRSGDPGGVDRVVVLLEQDRELVAAEAGERVGRRVMASQPSGDGEQDGVAGLVAEAVVDRLEAVEVDVQHRVAAAGPAESGSGVLEPVEQQRPVRRARSGRRGRHGARAAARAGGVR